LREPLALLRPAGFTCLIFDQEDGLALDLNIQDT